MIDLLIGFGMGFMVGVLVMLKAVKKDTEEVVAELTRWRPPDEHKK
jgi:hypothetical protein